MFSGFVERHLLIKNPFDRAHHRLEAMHPESEGFVWLVVSLLLLKKKINRKQHVGSENPNKENVIKKRFLVAHTNLDLEHLSLIPRTRPHHIVG